MPNPRNSSTNDPSTAEHSPKSHCSDTFGTTDSFENEFLLEAVDKSDAKVLLDKSNSSAENTLNKVADQSEAEIGTYFGNLSNIAVNMPIQPKTPSPAKSCLEPPTDGSESNECVPGVVKDMGEVDIAVFNATTSAKSPDVSTENGALMCEETAENAAIPAVSPEVSCVCPVLPVLGSVNVGMASDNVKNLVDHGNDVFIRQKASSSAEVSRQMMPYDDKFLAEAKEASKRVWESLVAKSTIRGVKRERPAESPKLGETDQKLPRSQNNLEACMLNLKALSIADPNTSKHAFPVNSVGASDGLSYPIGASVASTSSELPLMVEMGRRVGSLCGILPLADKLCAEPACSETSKPLPVVIGCVEQGSTNQEEA